MDLLVGSKDCGTELKWWRGGFEANHAFADTRRVGEAMRSDHVSRVEEVAIDLATDLERNLEQMTPGTAASILDLGRIGGRVLSWEAWIRDFSGLVCRLRV